MSRGVVVDMRGVDASLLLVVGGRGPRSSHGSAAVSLAVCVCVCEREMEVYNSMGVYALVYKAVHYVYHALTVLMMWFLGQHILGQTWVPYRVDC